MRLNISEGITSVVGPNGSGKSNVVDAIRWLFGEQSMKNIRAESREDVIFGGSDKTPPANSAYVKLTFETPEGQLSIGREVSRDGGSQYLIDDKPARLKDIKELFKGTGVGLDTYSIVGQGQVDKVVSATPEELRLLVEEAAGTAIYKQRKKEALSKLQSTESNLERILDNLNMIDKQRKSLYLKAKRAEKHVEYSEKVGELKRVYFGNLIERERGLLQKKREEKSTADDELKDIQKNLIEKESKWSALRKEFSEVDKEIETFTQLLEDHKRRQNDLLELKEMYSSRHSEKESKIIETSTKIDSLKAELEDLQKRREELKLISDQMKQQIQEDEVKLNELEKIRDTAMADYSEKEKEWLGLQEELDSVKKQVSKIDNDLDRIMNNTEDFKKRLQMICSQLDGKNNRLQDLQTEAERLTEQNEEVSKKQQETESSIESAKASLTKLEQELEQLREKQAKLSDDLRNSQLERSTLERQQKDYEGFSRSVKEVFQRRDMFSGLVDVVANVIEAATEYETAISVLLGNRMQDIIVDDSLTAKRIVTFLKESKIGRATLLPLDMISDYFSKNKKAEKHAGFVGYAAELVEVPQGFESVPKYLFGNAIVVKTLDDAIELRREQGVNGRIVSLDGQLLSAGGAITGGFLERDARTDLISRKRRIHELAEREISLQNDLSVVSKDTERKKDDASETKSYLGILREELNQIISENVSLNRSVSDTLNAINELEKEISELARIKDDYQKRLSEGDKRRDELTSRKNQLEGDKARLDEKIGLFSRELKEQKKELESTQSEIVDMKMQLSMQYDKQEQYGKELKHITQKQFDNGEQVNLLSKQLTDLEDEASKLKENVEEQSRELASLKKETEALFKNIRYQREGKEKRLATLQEVEEEIDELKSQREDKREVAHKLELSIQESEMKLQQIRETLGGEPEKVELLSDEELRSTKEELEDFENKLKFLGSVDLEAIDEYRLVDGEFQELYAQKEDLEEAKRKLEDLIEKTDKEARSIFLNTLEKINISFRRYVAELFEGAEGQMKILPAEDILESGIEIAVKRQGRKYQKLQLFSGGEKALVGIALVFALLSIKPSPFYVLDEVDAPLDDYNAERFKRMLRQHASDTQFVVITHSKIVMDSANLMHGVTMTDGVSRIIPVQMETYESVLG